VSPLNSTKSAKNSRGAGTNPASDSLSPTDPFRKRGATRPRWAARQCIVTVDERKSMFHFLTELSPEPSAPIAVLRDLNIINAWLVDSSSCAISWRPEIRRTSRSCAQPARTIFRTNRTALCTGIAHGQHHRNTPRHSRISPFSKTALLEVGGTFQNIQHRVCSSTHMTQRSTLV
jgi:hypothetical protein